MGVEAQAVVGFAIGQIEEAVFSLGFELIGIIARFGRIVLLE